MPLGDVEAHFNLDSWGGWIWPYRTHLKEAAPFELRITARNPEPAAAVLTITPVLPAGWSAEPPQVHINAGAREEAACTITVTPAGICRRQPIAVELTVNNSKRFGQVAEALVTIGSEEF